jgi:hypothetical protein
VPKIGKPTSLFRPQFCSGHNQIFRNLQYTSPPEGEFTKMATTNHALDHDSFHSFAGRASLLVGSKWAFTTALLIILFWGLSGPYFHFL